MRKTLSHRVFLASLLSACTLPVYAKGTGYLFISSEKDNNITVLDGKTYEVVKRIGTEARPRHLQFNADKTQIYAAAGDGNAIDVIDVAKLELVDRIGEIDDPELFDLSADGKTMYISLEEDGALGILNLDEYFAKREGKPDLKVAEAAPEGDSSEAEDDAADNAEEDDSSSKKKEDDALPGMTTVEVGEEPEGILVSPDGKTAYVTSEVANTVHVVDTASKEIKANIVVGNRPRRFALTPDQKELWVSNELSGSVSIIDPATHKLTETINFLPPSFRSEDVTPVGITLSKDGKTAVVALGRANHVAFVDVPSRKVTDYVLVGKRAWNTTLNKDDSLLFVVNGLSDDISIIDMKSRKVLKSVPIARVPHTVLVDD
ncbi:MAG: hypothetical protein E6Q83_09425 [Thiothrix sp.]|nr:MAG: hypothetical protein E6Q83_09425 [Thiothrix sp.]